MAKVKKKVKKKLEKLSKEKGKKRQVLVSLPGGPLVVVTASNNEEAYDEYKKIAGIISSDHMPRFKIYRDDGSITINDKGVVIDPDTKTPIVGSFGSKSDFADDEGYHGDEDLDAEEEVDDDE